MQTFIFGLATGAGICSLICFALYYIEQWKQNIIASVMFDEVEDETTDAAQRVQSALDEAVSAMKSLSEQQ